MLLLLLALAPAVQPFAVRPITTAAIAATEEVTNLGEAATARKITVQVTREVAVANATLGMKVLTPEGEATVDNSAPIRSLA